MLRCSPSAANAAPKQFVWPGAGAREAKASVKFGGTDLGWSSNEGLWAVFQFFEEAGGEGTQARRVSAGRHHF